MNKIRTGDQVIVTAGKDKGKQGSITKILSNGRCYVSGGQMVKRHTKPSAESPKGGIIEKQLPVAISNLSLLTKNGDKTKVGYRFEDGKKVRYSKKSNEIL